MSERAAGKVVALVGGQFGSEGKGVVAHELSKHVGAAVRTGGPNAGHSFMSGSLGAGFTEYVQQSVPVAWTNPDALLVIGPGAVVNRRILEAEVRTAENAGYDLRERLLVDCRASYITTADEKTEGHTEGEMHASIGSTGEGVGEARVGKLRRNYAELGRIVGYSTPWSRDRTDAILRELLGNGRHVLLEGTQGYGLSLHLGYWPFVTSANCTAQQLASDAGLPRVDEVVMVVRCYPIRVAGNSGPLENELSWDLVSAAAGRSVEERTTVTKKVRRVASYSSKLVSEAAAVNGATAVVLTFADYLDGGSNQHVTRFGHLGSEARGMVDTVESDTGCPVVAVGTGYDTTFGWSFVDRGLRGILGGGA